jgi:uncharacterized membrane protein YhiD involved in acid resistance
MNYLIPKNVKARFEFFSGFGFKELLWLLAGIGLGAGISMLVYLVTHSLFSFIVTALFGTIGFIAGKPDPRTGLNGVDHFKAMRAFQSKRRLFFYRHGDGR